MITKKLIYSILALCISNYCQAQVTDNTCYTIKRNYYKLLKSDNFINENNFINSLPNSYSSFVNIFGYNFNYNSKSYKLGCLCDSSYNYINKLFSLSKLKDIVLYKKILRISKNSKWQSDGINIFHHETVGLINSEKGDSFFLFLNSQSDDDIRSFIKFLLFKENDNNSIKKVLLEKSYRYPKIFKKI